MSHPYENVESYTWGFIALSWILGGVFFVMTAKVALEVRTENAFVRHVKRRGLEALKLRIDGQNGFPDRTVFLGDGRVFYIEFKRTAADSLRPAQRKWKTRLEGLGFTVLVTHSLATAIEEFEKWLKA